MTTSEPPAASPRPRLVLVVPCFNEAARLDRLAFESWVSGRPGVRFLFVNDGSTDATAALLDSLQERSAYRISVLSLCGNVGKGEAVRLGILHARELSPDFIGFWDADLATPLAEVDALLNEFDANPGVEAVFAARVQLMGRSIKRRAWRHYSGRVFATLVSMGLRLPIYDTQCGAKIFRNSELLGRITGSAFATRWLFDVELIARMIQHHPGGRDAAGAGIVEVPIRAWRDVGQSTLTLPQYVRAAMSVLTLLRVYGVHPRTVSRTGSGG